MNRSSTRSLPTFQAIQRASIGAPISKFRKIATLKQLSHGERRLMLDTMECLFAGLYTHLPLKRARYGFDPVQRLRNLRAQIEAMPADEVFNAELGEIFARLRDWHTGYKRPRLEGKVAVLPFLIESYGDPDGPRYIVTNVPRWLQKKNGFGPGVEVETWNAMPIDRVVQRHGERESGGRPDSLRAMALTTLTTRALQYLDLPDEERVEIGYRIVGPRGKPVGKRRYLNFEWRVVDGDIVERFTGVSASRRRGGGMRVKALNHAAAEVKKAKLLLYAAHALRHTPRPQTVQRQTTAGAQVDQLPTKLGGILKAATIAGPGGPYGYLRIYHFDVPSAEAFLREVKRLLKALPQRGLIVDVRDNPGGVVVAAEMALQFFTPHPIEPVRFSMLATDYCRQYCSWGDNADEFRDWRPSLLAAIRNGEPYSCAFPITQPSECNFVGQVYGGPVVLVADSTTYSSGDLFSAGFVDNRIGPLVCVGESTGAGGASVADYADLRDSLKGSPLELPRLPDGAGMTLALMRATRAGPNLGAQIEDVGVSSRRRHASTRDDLLHDNRDLLAKCIAMLRKQPVTFLECEYRKKSGILEVASEGLNQIDIRVDGRSLASMPVADGTHKIRLAGRPRRIEIMGLSRRRLKQRRVLEIPGP
jgi:hypothetical protein